MKIKVELTIRALNECDLREISNSKRLGVEVVNKITEALKEIDTTGVYFDFKISCD